MRASTMSEREGRLIDHDEFGLDGKEEARGIFLMLEVAQPAPPRKARKMCKEAVRPADIAAHHLRLGRRRQIDPDRAPAFRAEPHSRRPARALERDSKRHGTDGDNIDFALLVDGLEAEREQGITIDVAYRYVSTPRRSFIIADTPGHEQYTRNMATAASCANLAILLVDARKGLLTQTCRHAAIVSLLGIRHVVLAVNKIDLTGFDQAGFEKIVADFLAFAAPLGFKSITPIPISARHGDNVSEKSANTPWHKGPALLEFISKAIDVEEDQSGKPFRFPVQWVNRPHLDFRGFTGTIASGTIRPGDEIVVAASGKSSKVARIVTADGDLASASAGEAVTLTLADELDIARGDVLSDPKSRPEVADQFAAHLIWMSEEKLLPGRSYLLKSGSRTVPVTITELKHRLDVNTLGEMAARTLSLNEVGLCNLGDDDADRLRSLCRQSFDGLLHPDRPRDQRHGRRRASSPMACAGRPMSICRG